MPVKRRLREGSPAPTNEEELDDVLSSPTTGALKTLRKLRGDFVILGAGGKMGPTLARMIRRALEHTGQKTRVVAVSRFSSADAAERLTKAGVELVRCDLADRDAVAALPDAANVLYLAGQKFGTTSAPSRTWGINVLVPALVGERYAKSRIVAFSTGNVYSLTKVSRGGSRERDELRPVGEYALTCAARERMFEYSAQRYGTPTAIMRLNYAIDLRYGVLSDIALKVFRGEPVDARMGYVNVIWQGDANARALQCLEHASVPPFVVNVTGVEAVSVRSLASRFGQLFDRPPTITGVEADDALLSNASLSKKLFGPPVVGLDQMIKWTADWIRNSRPMLGKPTFFETRDGAF